MQHDLIESMPDPLYVSMLAVWLYPLVSVDVILTFCYLKWSRHLVSDENGAIHCIIN